MHKWKSLKRVVPFCVSAAMVVSNTPAVVLAEELFVSEAAFTDTVESEPVQEEIVVDEFTSENPEDLFGDGSEEMFSAEAAEFVDEEIEAAQDSATVTVSGVTYNWTTEGQEGYTQIGETGVYYAPAEGQEALTGTLYGKATLSYSEYYAGDTSKESYDAVTSATTKKYTMFSNGNVVNLTESGYQIDGVKNVNVAVDAAIYVEAAVLKAAGMLPGSGAYAEAAEIVLNENAAEAAAQYKALQADGSYAATTVNVLATVTDAEFVLEAPSHWGDYEIGINETTTSYLRRKGMAEGTYAVGAEIQGIIVEATDGTKVGMRHMEEIWINNWELAFDAETAPELIGKTVNRITYLTPDGAYVFENRGLYIKNQPADGQGVGAEFLSSKKVKVSGLDGLKNAKVSVYYETPGQGHHKVQNYLAQDVTATNGVVSLSSAAASVNEEGTAIEYIIKVSSDEIVDMSTTITMDAVNSVKVSGVTYNWTTEGQEGYTQIGETGVYYAPAEGQEALTGTLYGKAALSYSEFYAGDTSKESYDAVTSATTRKYTMFTNGNVSNLTESGYQIDGVKNVSVAVDAVTYVEASILDEADKLPESGVYAEAAGIALNDNAAEAAAQYKTLQADGSYSATVMNVLATVTDAYGVLEAPSIWGDYEIQVMEPTTSYLRRSREDIYPVNAEIQGIIVEATDGTKVGLRHMEEMWIQNYEFAFSKEAGLTGKTVSKVTYLMPNGAYEFEFAEGVYIKNQPSEGMEVTAEFVTPNTVQLEEISGLTNAKVSVYYETGAGHHKVPNYLAEDVTVTDGRIALTEAAVKADADGNPMTYIVKVSSDDVVDMTANIQLTADYVYAYAALDWDEYWASEGVYNGSSTEASAEVDGKGEADKGAFDAVTRATVNHGLHRGSFQCAAIIYDTDGNSYKVSHWVGKNTIVLTDGSEITFNRGTITTADGENHLMNNYQVTGIKYVPVKVAVEDYAAFCEAYDVVESGQSIAGGFSEMNLVAYEGIADITEATNGLKTAVKNEDGSFSFSQRVNGSESGMKDSALNVAEGVEINLRRGDESTSGSYGEFLRVDLLGNYGGLGSHMQAVRWDYYGTDSTYSNVVSSFGTKFAADNWMHKVNGIQLGLTDSARCQLPEGYDGSGYWKVTVYAQGYADYSFTLDVKENNIVKPASGELDMTALNEAIAAAEALTETDYTPETWQVMLAELAEAKEVTGNKNAQQSTVNEAIEHLNEAVRALAKYEVILESTSGSLYPGKETTLSVTLNNLDGKEVTYTSSDVSIATVDANGKVTAVKPGTAVITVSCEGHTAEYKLTVKTPTVKLNKTKATIYIKGDPSTTTLKATLTGVTGTVKYKSSDSRIAAVDENGKVRAKRTGTVTITASCGDYKATCKVTVKNPSMKLSKTKITLYTKGDTTENLKLSRYGVTGTVKYKSSNTKVVSVNSKGKLTAKKTGTATITVTCGKYKVTCKVTVKNPSLSVEKTSITVKKGKTAQIEATARPSGTIKYKSSNSDIVYVNSKGKIKGMKKGTAYVTVSCNGVSKKVKITVK